MELIKSDLISIGLLQVPLEQNFAIIEECLNNLQTQIKVLKINQEDQILKVIDISRVIRENNFNSAVDSRKKKRRRESVGSQDSQSEISSQNNLSTFNQPAQLLQIVQQNAQTNSVNVEEIAVIKANEKALNTQSNVSRFGKGLRKKERQSFEINNHFKQSIQNHQNKVQEKIKELQINNAQKDEQIDTMNHSIDLLMRAIGVQPKKQKKGFKQQTEQKIRSNTSLNRGAKQSNNKIEDQNQSQDQNNNYKSTSLISQLQKQIQQLKQFIQTKMKWVDQVLNQNKARIQNANLNLQLIERQKEAHKFDTTFLRTESTHFQQKKQKKYFKDAQKKDVLTTDLQKKVYKMLQQISEIKNQVQEYMRSSNQIQNSHFLNNQVRFKTEIDNYSHNDRKKAINNQKHSTNDLSQIKREHLKLREQFDKLMCGVNTGTHEIKTYIIKPNETKEDWKSLSTKIYRSKIQLQANIRELQNKINNIHETNVSMEIIEQDLTQCKSLIKKKVEINDYEKSYKRLENKLSNFIMQFFQKKQNQHDASLAKQPWFCLSCDGELKDYCGKTMKISTADKAIGKKVNPELHMVRRNQHKQEYNKLPSVHK